MDETNQSLLRRACGGSEDAWGALAALYRPLICHWLLRAGAPAQEADDLTQDILLTLVRELPRFRHSGQPGAFRTWLRVVATNRARAFWRARQGKAQATGDSAFLDLLQQLEAPDTDASRQWDREHDDHVLRCLLALMEAEFEPATLRAFRLLTLDGAAAAAVADELGMSVGAVYVAKSRVLRRLREEAAGLLD
jgi:RNA polymerase sigma-70 factor (ECF subfamily)